MMKNLLSSISVWQIVPNNSSVGCLISIIEEKRHRKQENIDSVSCLTIVHLKFFAMNNGRRYASSFVHDSINPRLET